VLVVGGFSQVQMATHACTLQSLGHWALVQKP
jgi:hypothetical protein